MSTRVVLLGIFVAVLHSQAPATQEAAGCAVSVAVVDSASGAPIQGATLILDLDSPKVFDSVTDVFGKYKFHVDQRAYSVTATAQGYSRQTTRLQCRSAAKVEIKLELNAQGVVSGRVTGDDGGSMPGAVVTLLRIFYLGGEKRTISTGGAVTGNDGQFTIDNLSGGNYFLVAVAPPAPRKNAEQNYIPTFYPSAADASGAVPIRISAPGEVGGSDVRMLKGQSYMVRGVVVSRDPNESAYGFVVTLAPTDAGRFSPHVTVRDIKGRFEFTGVVPGSYVLTARTPGELMPSARLPISVGDADLNDVELPLTTGAAASITLTSDNKDRHTSGPAYIGFVPWDTSAATYLAVGNGENYSVRLPLGLYRVTVGLRDSYAKTLTVDGQDSPDWIVDLSSPGQHQIQIGLGFDGGTIAGYVHDASGNPAPKMIVTLVPGGTRSLTSPQFAVTRSDDQGKFAFFNIAPGPYKVFAWERVDPAQVQNRTVLRQFEIQATDVQAQTGAAANADVTVIAASATASLQ